MRCDATFPSQLHIYHKLLIFLYVARYYQRVPGLTTSTCKLCGIFVPEGSRAHHLKSKHPEVSTGTGATVGEHGSLISAPASKSDRTNTSSRAAHLPPDPALSATEDAFAKHPTSLCTSALGLDTDLVAASAPVTLSVGALANGTESLSVDDVINDDQHPPCASADISSNPTVTGAGMHATNVDEFGLSATQRRLQIQAMTKLQQKLAKSHGEHSKKRSVGSDVAVAKKRAVDQGEMVLAEIDSDASTTLNASDSTPVKTATDSTPIKNNLIVRRAKQRTSLRSQTCLSYDSAEPLLPPSSTSLVNDAQSTCYVIHEESLGSMLDDPPQIPDFSQQTIIQVKGKGRKLDWPIVPHTSTPCQAGCENLAVAHYSCSHNFCDECLVGIRRHQKTKKSEAEQLYGPHFLPLLCCRGHRDMLNLS